MTPCRLSISSSSVIGCEAAQSSHRRHAHGSSSRLELSGLVLLRMDMMPPHIVSMEVVGRPFEGSARRIVGVSRETSSQLLWYEPFVARVRNIIRMCSLRRSALALKARGRNGLVEYTNAGIISEDYRRG